MTSTALALVVVAMAVLVYVSVGYPLLMRLLVAVRGVRTVRKAPITPSVSLVISAYNEAPVIGEKLRNALDLDYPPGQLEVVVISDASTDGTDDVVKTFEDRGVRLVRQPSRRGKTAGLNDVIPTLSGEIIVFSDANAMYERDAIRALVRNFADPAVGCVTGEARYTQGGGTPADAGERLYWSYEMQIKRLETAIGSMVGADGAIYAIRRLLWRPLPENAINDFLNPLQIVAAGWRAVYEPEAICYEEASGTVPSEYLRRVRIVSRSWRAVFQAPEVLNPLRVGLFAWSVVSHKVLRWMASLFVLLGAAGALWIAGRSGVLAFNILGLVLLAALAIAATVRPARRAMAMGWYFIVLNVASLAGLVKGTFGEVSGTWVTPRSRDRDRLTPCAPAGRIFLWVFALALVAGGLAWMSVGLRRGAQAAFWISTLILGYVFVGYPVFLAVVRAIWRRPVSRRPIEPTVCLLVTANDEASVIAAKLENALALDYPEDRLEIVVASDGSVDGTNEIVRRFGPRVRLLEFFPRRGKISAINDAMRSIAADVVVFSDANTFCEPQAIRELVANLADSSVGAVSGDVVLEGDRAALGRSEDLYYRYERWVQRAESDIGSTIGVDGALYAIRREMFVPLSADTILDDMAIPMGVVRRGGRVVFDQRARAHEPGCQTAREEFSRKSRVVAGAIQFLMRADSDVPWTRPQVLLSLVSHKALRWLTPLFALTAFLTSVTMAGSTGAYAVAASTQMILIAVALAGCVPSLRRLAVVSIPHYFFLIQAAAAVGIIRGLGRRQSVLWRRFERVSAQ